MWYSLFEKSNGTFPPYFIHPLRILVKFLAGVGMVTMGQTKIQRLLLGRVSWTNLTSNLRLHLWEHRAWRQPLSLRSAAQHACLLLLGGLMPALKETTSPFTFEHQLLDLNNTECLAFYNPFERSINPISPPCRTHVRLNSFRFAFPIQVPKAGAFTFSLDWESLHMSYFSSGWLNSAEIVQISCQSFFFFKQQHSTKTKRNNRKQEYHWQVYF